MKRLFGTRENLLEVLVAGFGIKLLVDSLGQWYITKMYPDNFGSNLVFGLLFLGIVFWKKNF